MPVTMVMERSLGPQWLSPSKRAEAESKDVRNPWFSRGLAMVLSKYVFGILRHLKPWVSLNLNHGKNRFETGQRNRRSTYGFNFQLWFVEESQVH